MEEPSLVLDLGGATAKFGVTTECKNARLVPNSISKAKNERRKVFIGDELNECKDFSGVFYVLPFQKGYLVNWDVQRQLFDYMFDKEYMKTDCVDTNLVITEPQFNFTSIKECLDEILFEEYRYKSICRTTAAQLSWWKRKEEKKTELCCLVVDSGFSFTHIVPICQGKLLNKGIRRIDIGGKALTNHLKDIVSYRQLHVLDETFVMNQVKEDCCFVSCDFKEDLQTTLNRGPLNTIARDYVLPDYMNVHRGFTRPVDEMWTKYKGSEQILRVNNERITVPEVLFNPSNIGIKQMGISEAITEAISSVPLVMQPHMYKNIVLTGGNCRLEGFKERVYNDVRSSALIDFDVNVYLPEDPITYAWQGGVELSHHNNFLSDFSVSRAEYEEQGRNICRRKFQANLN